MCSSKPFLPAFSFTSRRKERPFRSIDAHLGARRLDLASREAKRSPEWREGIVRADGVFACAGRPARRRRPADQLSGVAGDRSRGRLCRTQCVSAAQGAPAASSIDPSVEAPNALCTNGRPASTSRGARSAKLKRTPIFAIQSPRSARQTSCGSNWTSARGQPARMARRRSSRTGLLVVNPMHTLIDEARAFMPWLAQRLGRDGGGRFLWAWLMEPRRARPLRACPPGRH